MGSAFSLCPRLEEGMRGLPGVSFIRTVIFLWAPLHDPITSQSLTSWYHHTEGKASTCKFRGMQTLSSHGPWRPTAPARVLEDPCSEKRGQRKQTVWNGHHRGAQIRAKAWECPPGCGDTAVIATTPPDPGPACFRDTVIFLLEVSA